MPITTFLQEAKKFDVQTYKRRRSIMELKKNNVPFTGTPLKHPYDSEKIVLLSDPFSSNTFYYEFLTKDITYMEDLPSIVNMEGESMNMARLWVGKSSIALRCSPFIVADITTGAR